MRLASHEVRWFFDGELDEAGATYAWFTRRNWLGQTPPEVEFRWPGFESREDVYCVLSQRGDMGLKLRSDEKGTTLDIKGRTSELGSTQFEPNTVGNVERWVKWQYKNTEIPAAIRDAFNVMDSSDLVRIKKNRILRKVRLDAFGKDEEVKVSHSVDRGLNIELTKLLVNGGSPYWTLGFEAFPHDDDLHGHFSGTFASF